MSGINLQQIKTIREQFRKEAESLKQQIQLLQTQLIQCEARVQVYNELLKGEVSTPENLSMHMNQDTVMVALENSVGPKKSRTTRTTKAEMHRRRDVIIKIFKQNGNMKPSDLLPIVSDSIGVDIEPNQLRAILQRFATIFERKEEHGVWGLKQDPSPPHISGPKSDGLVLDGE